MRLVLLGTGGYHPNERRHTACLMIPEVGVIFDAGTAMFRIREFIQTNELDIFLSHAHLDHVVGLTYLLDVLHESDVQQVRVHGDEHKLEAVREHLFSEHLFPVVPEVLQFVPLAGDVDVPGQGGISFFALRHPGGSLGFRADFPSFSLAYVTDTTTDDASYLDSIRDVDLLLHECNFRDSESELAKMTGHSTSSKVAELAIRANAKRLIMLHINALDDGDDPIDLDKARSIFPYTELAEDLQIVDLGA